MDAAGINAPLVLLVQHWLKRSGLALDHTFYEMDELIGFLKGRIP
jgi:hypothetical protein